MKNLWILFVSIIISACCQDDYLQLKKSVEKFEKTTRIPPYLKSEVCNKCSFIAEYLVSQRKNGMNDTEFSNELLYFCNVYSGQTTRMCQGQVEIYLPTLLYIIDNSPNFTASDICALGFPHSNCALSSKFEWSIDIPPRTTHLSKPKPLGNRKFNILHISDIHFDPRYTPNKTTRCNEKICCQDDQPEAKSEQDRCGYWSSYHKADIPWRLVVNALEQTKKHDYDYVYFTGDFLHHRFWSTSERDNAKMLAQLLDAFSEYYKVPVYIALGNNDPHPSNFYSEVKNSTVSTQWLYDLLLQKISKWIPIKEVKETILTGGYYTVSPRKGFRVIVLNNNIAKFDNLWLLDNPHDPYGQLKWLTQVLKNAEENNERVHLLYHMVTGRADFYKTWSREFGRILNRFSDIIAAQFNGHTHKDEFYIYYNATNTSQPLNVCWNGGSITTYQNSNPGYKILSIDADNFGLLDFEEWFMNLTMANLNCDKTPKWCKLYSFKNAYGVKSMEADDINNLVYNFAVNPDLLYQYFRFRSRNSDSSIAYDCDDTCKKQLLCIMVTTDPQINANCAKLKHIYDNQKLS